MSVRNDRARRRGFTIIEIFITALIMLVVLGVAFTFMSSSMRETKKAQGLSEAVQAGALILHALQSDLANVIPQSTAESTIDRKYDPDSRTWTLSFSRRTKPLEFDMRLDGQEDPSKGNVEYTAAAIDPNATTPIYRITRTFPTGTPEARATLFTGAYAEAIRFDTFQATSTAPPGAPLGTATSLDLYFVRVNMLLLGVPPGTDSSAAGGPQTYDPNAIKSADRPKPYLLTFLARMPAQPTL